MSLSLKTELDVFNLVVKFKTLRKCMETHDASLASARASDNIASVLS